jgi:hypothetical protein
MTTPMKPGLDVGVKTTSTTFVEWWKKNSTGLSGYDLRTARAAWDAATRAARAAQQLERQVEQQS